MASSPSPLLKLELQASGEHDDTWGDNLNATLVLIENAISKRASVATTGGTTTLTDTQFADNQDRCSALDFSGVLVSNATIVVPTRTKSWVIRNQCTGAFTLTVKTSAGTGVVVTQGQVIILWCDGTNVVSVGADASTLGGISPSGFAQLAAANAFTKGVRWTFLNIPDAATLAISCLLSKNFDTVLAGNRTVTLADAADGSEVEYYLTQDGTGGRTVTWPSNIIWEGGAAPALSTAPNKTDHISLVYKNSITSWYGQIARNIGTGGGSTIADVTVTAGAYTNLDVWSLAGQPAGAVTFAFTLESGVSVGSISPLTPAIDFSGFAAGSVISAIIGTNCYVTGAGGRGGNGGYVGDVDSANIFGPGSVGTAGGTAIRLPSGASTINITNNGHIWGGGGGGGGGGPSGDGSGTNVGSTGGGGGGGAGSGVPGSGGSVANAVGAPGGHGGTGRTGVGGLAGAGVSTGGGGGAANGGAGGVYGAAGTAGTAVTSGTFDAAAGAGGAAGKAIDYNGGSTPTYVITGDIVGVTS